MSDEAVRQVIRAFNENGVQVLKRKSRRPHTIQTAFDAKGWERLKALLHQTPRTFGKPTSVWTLELSAQVSCEQGLTQERVSGETIRASLQRLGQQMSALCVQLACLYVCGLIALDTHQTNCRIARFLPARCHDALNRLLRTMAFSSEGLMALLVKVAKT